jgi:nucleotide-binding universal stress UspA family protein
MTSTLIYNTGRILAAIDASVYADSIAQYAAWAATRTKASLELVHVLDRHPETAAKADFSGNIGIDARAHLLDELATLDEQRSKLAMERGRQLLQQARRLAEEAGASNVDSRLRHGELVDTLTDMENDVRLFVLGKRGEHADFAKGHLGSNLERVVRAVHRPVLVASRAFAPVKRFLIAFDGSATTRKCVDVVCASPLLKGCECELLMVADDTQANRKHLDWALTQLRAASFDPRERLVRGDAERVIVEAAQGGVDLIVMGAYGHSRIRQLIVGSTTTNVLRRCQIPMLLLR